MVKKISKEIQNPVTFQLVGIIPLENCHSHFRKNLKIGEVYALYSDYEFVFNKKTNCLETFEFNTTENGLELYGLKNGMKLNISAIVGKNGSGKSSLIELFYYVLYKFSIDKGTIECSVTSLEKKLGDLEPFITINNARQQREHKQGLKELLRLHGFSNMSGFYREILKNLEFDEDLSFKYFTNKDIDNLITDALNKKVKRLKDQLEKERTFHELLSEELNVSVLFRKEKSLLELQIIDGIFILKDWSDSSKPDEEGVHSIDLKSLFYTLSINYSHHSLNSSIIGNWLDSVFHKNDGYKTPLVVNPMRKNGNFDINREEEFARSRLLANLISARLSEIGDRDLLLNDQQNIIAVQFGLKERIRNKPLSTWALLSSKKSMAGYIIKDFLLKEVDTTLAKLKEVPYAHILADYFVGKFLKMIYTYDIYSDIRKESNSNSETVTKVYEHFKIHYSHITFKLKQVINYFKNQIHVQEKLWAQSSQDHLITVSGLIIFCNINKTDAYQSIVEKLPPAIFDIDFIFSTDVTEEKFHDKYITDKKWLMNVPRFGKLSSGEKQLIHSVQTLIYHLSNLNSIDISDPTRIQYNCVNVVLDEIELYFHPDLQRRFVKYLHESLERLRLSRIRAVNILFATHSPFILSDIPSTNILRLKEGVPQSKGENTFAANIYDLLKDDFFLEDGVIGEFAKDRITALLTKAEVMKEDMELIEMIGDPLLKGVLEGKVLAKVKNQEIIQRQIDKLNSQLKQNRDATDS